MRITKKQITKIIKEELRLAAESTQAQDAELHTLVDKLIGAWGPEEVAKELEGLAQEIRMDHGSADTSSGGEINIPEAPPIGSQTHQRRRFYKNR